MNGQMMLLAGNSNKQLFSDISKKLGTKLIDAKISRFSDSEVQVQVNESIRGSEVFVLQATCDPCNDNLMELLIMIDALKRASASRIFAVIPYFGYARQDRKAHPREPISAKLVANLIQTAGADHMLAIDLHSAQIQGFFDIPVDNLTAVNLFSKDIEKKNMKNVVIVAPDVGGVARARSVAKRIDAPLVIIEKRRSQANESEVMNVIGEVKGRNAIIVDDIIDTAGTLCNAVEALKKEGAKDVYAYCTHGVFSGKAIERLAKSEIKGITCTDSIPLSEQSRKIKKIRQISVAELLAEAIQRTHKRDSVSELFQYRG